MRSEASDCVSSQNTQTLLRNEGTEVSSETEIFGQRWSLTFWDEAQWLRTGGTLSHAAHAIRMRCGSMVFCSATPLHNGEKVRTARRSYADISGIHRF